MNLTEKLQNLSHSPGVYQMLDKHAEVIYVGKAKNLKKRVSSYFSKTHTDGKTKALVANIQDFKIIVTETETQALLLENELIKQHKPRYNVLLKDAKSYPYIFISNDQHPRAGLYRGNKNKQFQYFGPYPSAQVVRNSLSLLKSSRCDNAPMASIVHARGHVWSIRSICVRRLAWVRLVIRIMPRMWR